MTAIYQTQEELECHLKEHIGFLEASNKSFDAGVHAEAKRLAATIRILVHDTVNSKSLLSQLGIKDKLNFLSSAKEFDPDNLMAHLGLVGIRVDETGVSYFAMLDELETEKKFFDDWWNQLVIKDNLGGAFTRKDLVLTLANKDGGAHVDPKLSSSYVGLSRNNSVGILGFNSQDEYPLENIVLHSIRQVAFEILKTLNESDWVSI